MTGRHRPIRCATSAFCIALATASVAANAEQSASGSPDGAAATPASVTEAGLQDIVVTAQRKSENLQRAAISVTAVNANQLANASITTAANLTAVVPALQASNQSGYTAFYIRGIGSAAFNPYSEPAVAFNLNGVYIARPNAVNGQFFDVERVEVLKGPQGTLYGRNATGGAVNLLSRKPDLGEFSGYLGAQYGNYDHLLLTGALNVPMGENGGLRLAFQTEDRDGFYRDGSDDAKSRSFRISMRSELTPDVSINIVGDYAKLGGRGGGATLLPLGTVPVRGGLGDPAVTALYANAAANSFIFPGAITPLPQYLINQNAKTGGVLAEITARTPIGTLTFLPAYRELTTDTFTTTTSFWVRDRVKQQQSSVELRLASDEDQPFRYLFGGYYFSEKSDYILEPDSQFLGIARQGGKISTETAAAFSQLTYAVTDSLRLTGGLRYTWERKGFDAEYGPTTPAVFTSGPGLNPLVVVPGPILITVNGDRTFRSTTWKAGVEWDAGPRSLVYANVGTGFKSGGFFFAATDNSYDPEKVTSFVVGTKNRFFSNALQFNAEAYVLKYKDQQLAHLAFVEGDAGPLAGYPTENVGRSTIYGFEVDAQYLATETLLFGLQLNYARAKYDDFSYSTPDISALVGQPAGSLAPNTGCAFSPAGPNYVIDCSGRKMFQVPTWTISGNIRKTFRLGNDGSVVAEVRSRYESARWLSDTFLPVTHTGSNTRTDANLTYNAPGDRWSLTAYVNNIENKDVLANAFLNTGYPIFPVVSATLRPPRTFGVRGQFSF